MAKWLDKISNVADKVTTTLDKTVSNINNTYKDKGIEGILGKTEETFSTITEKAQNYFKNIGDTNREIMTEVESKLKDSEKQSINPKIASLLAATVNTTQTIAEDLINVGKKTFDNISQEISQHTATDKKTNKNTTVEINAIPLETVFKVIFKAEQVSHNMWNDLTTKQQYIVKGQEWWALKTEYGGKGPVSLLAFHLSILAKRDYYQYNKELEFEAIGVLKNCFSNQFEKVSEKDLSNPTIQTSEEVAAILNPQEKKTTAKKRASKTAIKKNELEAVKKYSQEKTKNVVAKKRVAKKTAKKTTAKKSTKSSILKNEKDAVELYEKQVPTKTARKKATP